MDYETRMNHEAKKKKGGQLFGLIFSLIVLGGIAYFYYNWQHGNGDKKFKQLTKTLLESAEENYKNDKLFDDDDEKIYTFPNKSIINFDDRTLKGGEIRFTRSGQVELAVYDDEWCATKSKYSEEIEVTEYRSGECMIK